MMQRRACRKARPALYISSLLPRQTAIQCFTVSNDPDQYDQSALMPNVAWLFFNRPLSSVKIGWSTES